MNIEQNRPNGQEMVSSTGSLGLERRSYDRLYWNWRGLPLKRVGHLASAFSRLERIAEREGMTRTVFRGLFTEDGYENLLNHHEEMPDVQQEVALRITSWKDKPCWVVVLGRNAPNRNAVLQGRDFYQKLNYHADPNFSHCLENGVDVQRSIENILRNRFTISSEIRDSMVESLQDLWGPTFEWTEEGVRDLQKRLQRQKSIPSSPKFVWFTGVEDDGKVVAAATAERIDFKRENEPLTLVESTEWVTYLSYRKRGLMTGAVNHLNAQILNDLGQETVIYAECNWKTGAYRVGRASGLVMPEPNAGWGVYNILRQNVAVGDGREPVGLRDFVFMYLSKDEVVRSYSQPEILKILQGTS